MAGLATRLPRGEAAAPAKRAGEARPAPPAAVQPPCLAGSACSDSCLCQGPGYTCDAGICKVGCSRQMDLIAAPAESGWRQGASGHPLGLPAHLCALRLQAEQRFCLQPFCLTNSACGSNCVCKPGTNMCDAGTCKVGRNKRSMLWCMKAAGTRHRRCRSCEMASTACDKRLLRMCASAHA